MDALNPVLAVLVGFLLAAAVTSAFLALTRRARTRARSRRRVVEKPNSHYTATGVKDVEARHRWRDIDLSRVHEINRGEVTRLVAKADAAGVESLRPAERTFLDQIERTAGRKPPEQPAREAPKGAPTLRELPA